MTIQSISSLKNLQTRWNSGWLNHTQLPPKYYGENSVESVAQAPIGSGAYKFVEWVKDDHITLERNEDYWGPKPAFKKLVSRVIPGGQRPHK